MGSGLVTLKSTQEGPQQNDNENSKLPSKKNINQNTLQLSIPVNSESSWGQVDNTPSVVASSAAPTPFQTNFNNLLSPLLIPFARKKAVVRRPPLTATEQILNNKEAYDLILYAVNRIPPGIAKRWNKMLNYCNRVIDPTPNEPDPLRLSITLETLREVLQSIYHSLTAGNSEGITQMRRHMTEIYDKHSAARGKRVSQKERNDRGLTDECYAYGELDFDIFATIHAKIIRAYGERQQGIFCDLGCGVGTLVYAAAFIGNFKKCTGVEFLDSLLLRGEKRGLRWNKLKSYFTAKAQEVTFEWSLENFLVDSFWTESTFIFLHWTAFSSKQRERVAVMMRECLEGTFVVSITQPVPSDDFEILIKDVCQTSWGIADYFVQEKVTRAINADEYNNENNNNNQQDMIDEANKNLNNDNINIDIDIGMYEQPNANELIVSQDGI